MTGSDVRALSGSFTDRVAWKIFADEPWWALADIRDMLNVFHPYRESRTSAAAGASREFVFPAHWKPPFALRFFCADGYFADAEKHKPGQVGVESFFGHRFKQVLIDDIVVWERDVTDENVHGSQTVFQVDITPHVAPGKRCRLTFRVFDKVSTLERNNRDVWLIGGTWYAPGDGKTEQPPRFHTAVWFADAVLGEKQAVEAAPPGERPHEAVVKKRHRARRPLSPRGERMSSSANLSLVTPSPVVASGYPLTCGVPMPPGALKDAKEVRLVDGEGRALPLQSRAIGWWNDGSIRWLLLNAIAPGGAKAGDRFRLHFGEGKGVQPKQPLKLRQQGERLEIDTGAISIRIGADSQKLIDAVFLSGKPQPALIDLAARMTVLLNGKPIPVTARWEHVRVVERGPVAAQVELSGVLTAAETHVGRFLFRLYAYAGLPTVQIHFRIFNHLKPEPYKGTEEDAPLDVSDLSLTAVLPGDIRGAASAGLVNGDMVEVANGRLRLTQDTAEHFKATSNGAPLSEGQRAQGWIAAARENGCVQASVWRFWQQCPKSLSVDEHGLEIGLFTPSQATPFYRPRFGEAKRHDICLTFSENVPDSTTRKALGLLADEPPRLFDGSWFCLSGGVNVMDPRWFQNQPGIAKWVEGAYGDVSTARVTNHFGIRNFGDTPYRGSQWLNGYWAMVQGALNWGLASGDQRWLQRSFEIARHIADVDTVHLPSDHPDWKEWNGLTCALGTDHSVHNGAARWAAFQIGESLILHHWMTGDPDSLEAGMANADYLIRHQAGLGSSEARSQARPMLTLLRAWQATGDLKYREGAARYLDLRYQKDHVIDWRRGAYIQPTYENWRCVSAGLDSMYAHNVYEYYRLTGDLDAAQMVVAIADSVYAESMLPQEEGIGSFLFYVRYSRNSWYYTQMAILFFMAYDLTEDIRFLRAGRAAFARYLLCKDAAGNPFYQPYHNFGWLDPEAGGWLRQLESVHTEPFTITSQTPAPDPANYEVPIKP